MEVLREVLAVFSLFVLAAVVICSTVAIAASLGKRSDPAGPGCIRGEAEAEADPTEATRAAARAEAQEAGEV